MKESTKEFFISVLASVLFWLPLMAIVIYTGRKDNYEYCDAIQNVALPKVCKLRYPILNTEEIKRITAENSELKEKISALQNRLDDLKDVLENGKEDNWEPDPIQRDY